MSDILRDVGVESFLKALSKKLYQGEFEFSPARQRSIPKRTAGERIVAIHVVEDAVVLRAILELIYPRLEILFHEASYGGRKYRSVSDAIARLCRFLSNILDRMYLVVRDVDDCFGSINHDLLWRLMCRAGLDGWTLELLERHLAAGAVTPGSKLVRPTVGIPQGSAVSPILANLVLNELDWRMAGYLEPQRTLYLRYLDDLLVAHAGTPGEARSHMRRIEGILGSELDMHLAPDKGGEGRAERWIEYLGSEVRRRNGKVASRLPPYRAKEIGQRLASVVGGVAPRAANAVQLRRVLNDEIQNQLSPYQYTTDREPMERLDRRIRQLVLRWLQRRHRRWSVDKIQKTYFGTQGVELDGRPIIRCVDLTARKPRNRTRPLPWEEQALMPPCAPAAPTLHHSSDKRPNRGRVSTVGGANHGRRGVFRASGDDLAPSDGCPVV